MFPVDYPPGYLGQEQPTTAFAAFQQQAAQTRQQQQAQALTMTMDADGNTVPSTDQSAPTDQPAGEPTKEPKKSRTGMWVMLGLAGAAVGLVYFAINTPVAGVDEKKKSRER